MNCPICGKKLDENGACPDCGGIPKVAETTAEFQAKAANEVPIEERNIVSATDNSSVVEEKTETGPVETQNQPVRENSKTPLIITFCAIVAVLAILAGILGSRNEPAVSDAVVSESASPSGPAEPSDPDGSDEQNAESKIRTGTAQELLAAKDNVLIRAGDHDFTLTNAEFNYYYWGEYYYFVSMYGTYYFDVTQPLEDQLYSDTMSWLDYFTESAIQTALQTMSVVFEAQSEGYVLEGEYLENFEATLLELEQYSELYGYETINDYLIASYGEGSDYESFKNYLYNTFYSSSYTDTLYYSLQFSDQELSDYYDTYATEYQGLGVEKDDSQITDVRHILIMPETDEEGNSSEEQLKAAEDKINELYDRWIAEGGSEEALAALAEEYSDDTLTAVDGGMFEGVAPGQTLDAFDSWVFDPDRKIGDYGIIQTEIGYHIIYYSASQGTYWEMAAESDLKYETLMARLTEIADSYEFELNTDGIVISEPDEISAGFISAEEIISDEDQPAE